MNVAVTPVVGPPVQEITLTLTVEEFALLERLRWKHNGGSTSLRTALDNGFSKVLPNLHPHWADLVREARESRGRLDHSEEVARIFRNAQQTA